MKMNITKSLENLLNKKKILKSKLLSSSFNINCFKIITEDNKNYIVKFYGTRIKQTLVVGDKTLFS